VAARDLAEELGQLALVLEQAAATIDKLRCGFRRYLELWQSNRDRVVGWARPEITGYHHAVAATWQTSVDQLGESGRRLLERLAFLAPDPVPMFLLEVGIPELKAEDQLEALIDLAAVSLATREIENDRFVVHRLVQEATRGSLNAVVTRQRVIEALSWVNAAFEDDPADVRSWARLDPLAGHARSAVQWADREGIAQPTALLMNQLGVLLYSKSLHAQAEPLYRRALAIDETRLGLDHPDVARDLNNLAELLRATNRLAEAEPLLRRALAIDEVKFGPDHPHVAIHLNNLAQLLQATNRLREAEQQFRRALAIDEVKSGPDHPNVARALSSLAELLRSTNRLTEAEPMMRRALAIAEARFGPKHPEVAIRLNNLALLLRMTNRLTEAEPLMRRALAIDETCFGPDHSNIAVHLNNLARLLHATNRLGEAEPLYRRAVAIDEARLGLDHPTVATLLNNLALLLKASGRLAEAEPLYRRALAIDEASFGPYHPDVAIRLNNLAGLLRATNRLAESEPLMRRVLVTFVKSERKTGHPHPDRDGAIANYAGLLAEMGKSETEVEAAIAALTGEGGERDLH
jgi:tetratricopeptide (TPR) repeat protein